MSGTPRVELHADGAAVARAEAEAFVAAASEALTRRGRFDVALSGGSTPKALHALLAGTHRAALDWSRIHLWSGDERCVPADHADANARMFEETLFAPLAIPASHRHLLQGGALDRDAECARFAELLTRELPAGPQGVPRFDLVLLGMGGDAHTASLFPGTGAVAVSDRLVMRVVPGPAVKPALERLTLTRPVLQAARALHLLVVGADKRSALATLLGPSVALETAPVRLVLEAAGEVVLRCDGAAHG